MKVIKWLDEKPKRITIKDSGVSATLHFVYNGTMKVKNIVWDVMQKKLKDDILCGRLVLVSSIKKDEKGK